jgi:hypothetical protein
MTRRPSDIGMNARARIGAAAVILGTCATWSHAGFILESRSTFVYLRNVADGSRVFYTENPSRGFISYRADGLPDDPIISNSDLPFYNFRMTSSQVLAEREGVFVTDGDYEINYGSAASPVPPAVVSSGYFLLTMTFTDRDHAVIQGSLYQDPMSQNPDFADLSCGGHPILLTGDYHNTYFPDGTWSGGGLMTGMFVQLAVPGVGTLPLLAVAAPLVSRRRR